MSKSILPINPSGSKSIPILDLEENDRLWLQTIYETSNSNCRPNLRQIKKQLGDLLPKNYDPENISYHLAISAGEEITLVGIIAVQRNYSVIEKANRIIKTLQIIYLESDPFQTIEASNIASLANIPENEVGLLLLLIRRYIRFCSSSGSRIPDYHGIQFFTTDDAAYMTIMKCETIVDPILKTFDSAEITDVVEEKSSNPLNQSTTATQVLAIHFLLKRCGINPIDGPSSVSRFIQFLNGKEVNAKRIQNTNIYKAVAHPLKTNDQSLLNDLLAIRQYFVEMELDDIILEIDKEIKICKNSG